MFPKKKRSETYRIPHKIPSTLVDKINELGDRHLPKPKRLYYFELLLEMGMDDYENGVPLKKEMLARPDESKPETGEWTRFPHHALLALVYRFNKLHGEHLPATSRREFFEYILMLGIQAYEREYTIYGFKKD